MVNHTAMRGDFLKTRRRRLQPADVGLGGHYGRRRTPGLRREEVAELAGVSTTWYTWLEQGRDVAASKEVMEAIGRALRLSPDEQRHLLRLSGFGEERPELAQPDNAYNPELQRILDQIAYPAIIANRRTELLAWNKQAKAFLYDFEADPVRGKVMTWSFFADPYLREHVANWEEFARFSVAILRGYYDRFPADPWYDEIVAAISEENPVFAELWELHEVQEKRPVPFLLNHPEAGLLSFELNTFAQINGNPDLHCCVYSPIAGTDTERKMLRFAAESDSL